MSALPSQLDPQSTTLVFQGSVVPAAPLARAAKTRWTGREWRVTALIVMIVLVSMADLYLTLTYLHNGGMAEGNPIARWVMSLGCPWLLAAWKGGMVLFTCTVLFAFKKRATTEVAAWICCIAMGWLVFQWSTYVRDVGGEFNKNPQLTEASSWVVFDKN